MKSTDENLFSCEQEYERRARLVELFAAEFEQEESDKEVDDKAFWKVVYILVHVAAALFVLTTLYRMWGK